MQKLTPFLWFEHTLSEVLSYYKSIFPDMKIVGREHYENTPGPLNETNIATVNILGQEMQFMAAGPYTKFTEAISLLVTVDTQEEVDYYWNKMTVDGGSGSECGWLKDKYGLSWQIVPNRLNELLSSPNKAKSDAAMQAMLKMQKLVISDLEKAYNEAN